MTYVSWAALYEGATDQAYFDLLIPRVMEELVERHGTRLSMIPAAPAIRLGRGSVDQVAREACTASEAFHLIFVHADTGGRNLEAGMEQRAGAYCRAMHALCHWPPVRCIAISPRHEMEAWILSDPEAVTAALGYRGSPGSLGLPADAHEAGRLVDPKAVLAATLGRVRGRRRPIDVKQILPAIAQRQSLDRLRRASSFAVFEARLRTALADLGCL